jgi:hypothetical protein
MVSQSLRDPMITPTSGISAMSVVPFFEGVAGNAFRAGRELFFMSADAEKSTPTDYNDLSINHSLQANDDGDQLNLETVVGIRLPPPRRKDAKEIQEFEV